MSLETGVTKPQAHHLVVKGYLIYGLCHIFVMILIGNTIKNSVTVVANIMRYHTNGTFSCMLLILTNTEDRIWGRFFPLPYKEEMHFLELQ